MIMIMTFNRKICILQLYELELFRTFWKHLTHKLCIFNPSQNTYWVSAQCVELEYFIPVSTAACRMSTLNRLTHDLADRLSYHQLSWSGLTGLIINSVHNRVHQNNKRFKDQLSGSKTRKFYQIVLKHHYINEWSSINNEQLN